MNKLMGFYELRELSIPTIPWKEYFPGVELSDEFLWTIRSAVNHGDDLNLHIQDRRSGTGIKKELHDRNRDSQYAAGCAYF